jgi:aryl-alcohol dehydrogenase-like predicted oxidoreductase
MERFWNERGFAVLSALDAVAAEAGATPAQVALAWIAAQPGLTAPIASARTPEQLEELLGAMTLDLTEAQVALLDLASRS